MVHAFVSVATPLLQFLYAAGRGRPPITEFHVAAFRSIVVSSTPIASTMYQGQLLRTIVSYALLVI